MRRGAQLGRGHRQLHHRSARCRVGPGGHRQAGPRRSGAATPSTSSPSQVRRRLLQRLLDRQLERHRRGRAVRAAALQMDPGHAVLQRQQLDVAAVGLHVRAHASRAPAAPALRAAPGAGRGSAAAWTPAVLAECDGDPLAGLARPRTVSTDPLQPRAVHPHDGRHELVGELTHGASRRRLRAASWSSWTRSTRLGRARRRSRQQRPCAHAIAVGVCITLRHPPAAGVHVHAARQARVERRAPPA